MVCAWGVAHNEVKRGFGSGQVGPGIVYVLGKWKPVVPGGSAVVYKDAEILFKPLIYSLRLAICLRVVGQAYVLFNI